MLSRRESLVAFAMAWITATAGLTWHFGCWGLIGMGTLLMVLLSFAKVRDDG